MGEVFHFIIMVEDVDAGVHQSEVGTELSVAGIQHIGEQRHLVAVAVVDDFVVLIRQPDAVFLCPQVGEGGQEVNVALLHGIFDLLLRQQVLLLGLTHVQPRLFQLPVVLEE